MSDYGQQTHIVTIGNSLSIIATGFADVIWKLGAITIDWASVPAVSGADVVLPGGSTVPIGQKYIPAGTVLVQETSGANTGKYGPYNSNVGTTDGRQTLDATRRGQCFILPEDLTQNPIGGALVAGNASDHPGVIEAGTVWKSRLQIGGSEQPTLANFLLAFPGIRFATM